MNHPKENPTKYRQKENKPTKRETHPNHGKEKELSQRGTKQEPDRKRMKQKRNPTKSQ